MLLVEEGAEMVAVEGCSLAEVGILAAEDCKLLVVVDIQSPGL